MAECAGNCRSVTSEVLDRPVDPAGSCDAQDEIVECIEVPPLLYVQTDGRVSLSFI